MKAILRQYDINNKECLIQPLKGGLINTTWKISIGDHTYILQQINQDVFKNPYHIAENIRKIDKYLKLYKPSYLFVSPIKTTSGQEIAFDKEKGYFRLFPFIDGSHTFDSVYTCDQAHEAAFQFGKFTSLLSGFDTSALHITIPDFHNLSLRYHQFENAAMNGNSSRIKQSEKLIKDIRNHREILISYENIKKNDLIRHRVTHHDTKISNVLFNQHNKGICIIDLDTIMPGYFISDAGDMMRTYLSPANEEEKDLNKIEVRDDFFAAIVSGYLENMSDELTQVEKDLFFYSGLFLTYMQAIRFLTDHLNNDIYYGARYEDHNMFRASNQIHLLKKLNEKKEVFQKIVSGK